MFVRFFVPLLVCYSAEARVFSAKESTIAAYIRGTGGMLSTLGKSAFADSSGTDTDFRYQDAPKYDYSGEAGVLWAVSDRTRLRFGLEGVQTREVDATGRVSGAAAMTVTSRILAVMPVVTAELDAESTEFQKVFLFAGAGYAKVKSTNNYAFTTSGRSHYGNIDDYKETVSGSAIAAQLGVGWEVRAIDNVTLVLEGGYRHLVASKLNYENTQDTAEGTTDEGGVAKILGGTKNRELDMSGVFLGFSFRFFIPPLN